MTEQEELMAEYQAYVNTIDSSMMDAMELLLELQADEVYPPALLNAYEGLLIQMCISPSSSPFIDIMKNYIHESEEEYLASQSGEQGITPALSIVPPTTKEVIH